MKTDVIFFFQINYSLHLCLILEIIFQYKSLNIEITVYCEENLLEIKFLCQIYHNKKGLFLYF